MQYDLLTDALHTVFAVNCRVEGTTLHCGALYLEPLIPSQGIRLADETASLQVELPAEVLNQAVPHRAWSVTLPLCNEQVRQSTV